MTRHFALTGAAVAVLMLAMGPAAAISINLGGGSDNGGSTINLGGSGSSSSDSDISVDSGGGGLLDLGGDGSGGLLDLGNGDGLLGLGDGGTDADIDLIGPGDNGETAIAVGTGSDNDDVLVTLFGAGDTGGTATVNLLSGGLDGATDIIGDGGIFGPGGDDDPTQTGSIGDNGGGGGAGIFGNGGTGANALRPMRVASRGQSCFTPDGDQIDHLLNRASYSGSVTASWADATAVRLVPVEICPDARGRLTAAIHADANVGRMQAAVAANARLRAGIDPYRANDVLAVDKSGSQLTVYVY